MLSMSCEGYQQNVKYAGTSNKQWHILLALKHYSAPHKKQTILILSMLTYIFKLNNIGILKFWMNLKILMYVKE